MLGQKAREFEVKKIIDDLDGIEDVVYQPRSWSPSKLNEACNNIEIKPIKEGDEIELIEYLSLQFILKKFFFLQHQTGLYNPQKSLWTLIAQCKKIKIKSYKGFSLSKKDREHTKISDLRFEDSTGRFFKLRVVHPGSKLEFPGFSNLVSRISPKCMGVFYISEQEPNEKFKKKIANKTQTDNLFDQYRSPLGKNCSLNLLKYYVNEGNYFFQLIHPDLGKKVGAELCLDHS